MSAFKRREPYFARLRPRLVGAVVLLVFSAGPALAFDQGGGPSWDNQTGNLGSESVSTQVLGEFTPVTETPPPDLELKSQRSIFNDPALKRSSDSDLALTPVQPKPANEDRELQVLPAGLIYRSYLAGVREPRFALQHVHDKKAGWLWDISLGGRMAVLRDGTTDPIHPQGWELDMEGAGLPRLSVDNDMELDAVDFRFGIPFTYGYGPYQFKAGYAHLSSHMGDERMLRGIPCHRLNYVRDAAIVGASYYWLDDFRFYAEVGYAACDDGAEPVEIQFGAEYSPMRPMGIHGSPFLAMNADLFQEHDYGGRFVVQTGWQWRGDTGHLLRFGMHYQQGCSEQGEFYQNYEDKIGIALWYDF